MRTHFLLLLILAACTPLSSNPSAVPQPGDGFSLNWSFTTPIYTDPTGDGGPSGVDFTTVMAAHTDEDLAIYIDLGTVVNLQSEPALALTLSAGGPALTYDLAAKTGEFGGWTIGHADIGLISLPTVTSDRFEIFVRRDAWVNDQVLFAPGAPVTITLADPNSGGDVVPAFSYAWDNPVPEVEALSPLRPPGALRIVSYNVLRDGVLDSLRSEYFGRILTALQPDVIAFQEVNNRSAASVEARVEEWLGGDWFALKQADLVTVSRYPFVEGWTDTFRPLDERIFAQLLEVDGQELLVFNAHFFCCDEDAGRQEQADGFAAFLRDQAPEGVPFLLVGDLNLVGDAAQLDTLLTGDILNEAEFGADHPPDWDGSPLTDLAPRHLLSAHIYTWSDAGSEFAPGRLDYVIYTDSLLEASGFVFDTADLPQDLLASLGVQAEDSQEASDHLPVVVDFRFQP